MHALVAYRVDQPVTVQTSHVAVKLQRLTQVSKAWATLKIVDAPEESSFFSPHRQKPQGNPRCRNMWAMGTDRYLSVDMKLSPRFARVNHATTQQVSVDKSVTRRQQISVLSILVSSAVMTQEVGATQIFSRLDWMKLQKNIQKQPGKCVGACVVRVSSITLKSCSYTRG